MIVILDINKNSSLNNEEVDINLRTLEFSIKGFNFNYLRESVKTKVL